MPSAQPLAPKADGATKITSGSLADSRHHTGGNNLADNIREDLTS